MNWNQKQYTLKRIESIKQQKIDLLKEKYSVESKSLKSTEMYDLIVAKKVKLYDRDTAIKNAGTWHPDVPHFFDFSKFTWNSHFAEGYETKKNALLKEVERIRDQIVLGDAAEALQMLADLENFAL